jgi:hypothetical protein
MLCTFEKIVTFRNNPADRGSDVLVRSGRQSRNGGSLLNELFRMGRDLVAGTLVDSAAAFFQLSLRTVLRYAIAVVLLGAGAVFLLLGGFEALRLLRLPDAAAYAIMGGIALAAGLAVVSSAGPRDEP